MGLRARTTPGDFGTTSQYPVLHVRTLPYVLLQGVPTVSWAVSTSTIYESTKGGASRAVSTTITPTLSGTWATDLAYTFPTDPAYTLSAGRVTIPAGTTTTAGVTLTAVNNKVDAANKTLSLSPASSHLRQTSSVGAITIVDDDELAKPAGVRVSVDGLKARVDWTAVATSTGYKVEWSTSSAFTGAVSSSTVSGGSTTNYSIKSGLTSGTTYYFRVIATVAGHDDSAPSDAVSATPTTGQVDYDTDDDGLIEVDSLAKLNAIRYDLNGDGVVDNASDTANAMAYAAAFPSPEDNMGCNESVASITAGTGNPACSGYELTANLDFNDGGNISTTSDDTYHNGGAGWLPIAHESTSPDGSSHPFNAVFEGNNYVISNLFINRRGTRTGSGTNPDPHIYTLFAGLFGDVGSGAKIRNLGVEDVSVTFKNYLTSIPSAPEVYAGGLAGYSAGEIFKTYVTGSVNATVEPVSGTDKFPHAGGLIGRQVGGSITSSYARVTTTANFAANDADSKSYAGGLVAYQDGGDIVATYARGSANRHRQVLSWQWAKAHAGGLIGYHKRRRNQVQLLRGGRDGDRLRHWQFNTTFNHHSSTPAASWGRRTAAR